MSICLNCGRELGSRLGRNCPYCHAKLEIGGISSKPVYDHLKNDYDSKNDRLLILSVIIPLVGLIYYYTKHEDRPLTSSSALGGSLIGIIVQAIAIVILLLTRL
ncbi:MAG TPA: hypothetical protein PLB45_01660 [Bacilli bacterium]|jgi:hypothetical protein|nr:hypothetical protein [Bacilli bacterium]HQC83565.1 hypothetical protein [Bacilli bacterium]